MCQTYICRYKPYNRPPFSLNSFRSAPPAAWVGPLLFHCHYLNKVGGRKHELLVSHSATLPTIFLLSHISVFLFENICFFLLMQEQMFDIIYLVLPYSVGGWSF